MQFRNNRKSLDSTIFQCCNAYNTYTDKYNYLGVGLNRNVPLDSLTGEMGCKPIPCMSHKNKFWKRLHRLHIYIYNNRIMKTVFIEACIDWPINQRYLPVIGLAL